MTRSARLIVVLSVALLSAGIVLFAITLATNRHVEAPASSQAAIGGPFTLMDTSSKTVSDQTYRGKWLLVYFGYTFCPDACPTALTNVSGSLEKLGSEAAKIEPLFITVDPKRDTPAVMGEYLKSFDPRIVGLTGSQAQIDSAAKAYRVYIAPQKSNGEDYLVDHSAYFYLVNPQGKFVNVIGGDTSGDQMADKLRSMMTHAGT